MTFILFSSNLQAMENGLRTYRPDLEQYVFGSDRLRQNVKTWIEGVKKGKSSRALLLTGPTGLGKTTLALAACKELGADPRDISEINCANLRTLDDARSFLEGLQIVPSFGDYRVLLLDEAHQMVPNAQQAFLTPLEKLSPNHILISCTSNPSQLLAAFKGRFYEIQLEEYSEDNIVDILSALPVKVKPSLVSAIARVSGGNPRRAISLLEKNMVSETGEMELEQELLSVEGFVEAVIQKDPRKAFLHAALVKEDNRRMFFERSLKLLEGAWLISQELTPALSFKEKEFLEKILKMEQKKYGHIRVLSSLLSTKYQQLVSIMNLPLEHLKAFSMLAD